MKSLQLVLPRASGSPELRFPLEPGPCKRDDTTKLVEVAPVQLDAGPKDFQTAARKHALEQTPMHAERL